MSPTEYGQGQVQAAISYWSQCPYSYVRPLFAYIQRLSELVPPALQDFGPGVQARW